MPEYVVMMDIHFMGIHVTAQNALEATALARTALDNLGTEREPVGITGIEYGLDVTKVLQVVEEEETE
jgi:hypothetical protein